MKPIIFTILTFLLFNLLSSCKENNSEDNKEQAIIELLERIPHLPQGEHKQIDFYKLKRSVTSGISNFQVQLRVSPDSLKDSHEILIITNKYGKSYAIPILTNDYRDYWDFKYDEHINCEKKANTTFSNEFVRAINTLNLNDTLGTVGELIDEVFISLLRCRPVNEEDSIKLTSINYNHRYNYSYKSGSFDDNFDSTEVRLIKNYKAIYKIWHPTKNYTTYTTVWDKNTGRLFQFVNKNSKYNTIGGRTKVNLEIIVYRTSYENILLSL